MNVESGNTFIDLRSDTVTHPTQEMRTAMAQAELGDDVYGEDPTVNELEEISADIMEKEAAVFVPSGTMGNLAAILAHCGRGDEVILGDLSHTFLYEAGGVSALGGVHPRTVPNQEDGTIALDVISGAVREDNPHFPITRLICLENTHNRCGGAVLSVDYMSSIGEFAKQRGLKLHLDGARIFNAAVAQSVSAAELARPADSVTFCLSKALCAPVGSVLCGSEQFISKARRARKQLGGGMRQAGVIAAAGVIALQKMIDRLVEDHEKAQELALGLSQIEGVLVEKNPPPSNMIFLSITDALGLNASQLAQKLKENGVLVGVVDANSLRLVTHYWIHNDEISHVIGALKKAISGQF